MSVFCDLFKAFPEKVAELCLDECFVEMRPVYYFDPGNLLEQRPACQVCGAIAVFHWRDDRYDAHRFSPPIPDLSQETCDDERCQASWVWISAAGREGSRRRRLVKDRFGKGWWDIEPEARAASIALVMLREEVAHAAN